MSDSLLTQIHNQYASSTVFVERVRAALKDHGITQAALARRSGFDPREVSKWMLGRKKPRLTSMLILDEALTALIEGR